MSITQLVHQCARVVLVVVLEEGAVVGWVVEGVAVLREIRTVLVAVQGWVLEVEGEDVLDETAVEVLEAALEEALDEMLDEMLEEALEEALEEMLGEALGEALGDLDHRPEENLEELEELDEGLDEGLDEKMDEDVENAVDEKLDEGLDEGLDEKLAGELYDEAEEVLDDDKLDEIAEPLDDDLGRMLDNELDKTLDAGLDAGMADELAVIWTRRGGTHRLDRGALGIGRVGRKWLIVSSQSSSDVLDPRLAGGKMGRLASTGGVVRGAMLLAFMNCEAELVPALVLFV